MRSLSRTSSLSVLLGALAVFFCSSTSAFSFSNLVVSKPMSTALGMTETTSTSKSVAEEEAEYVYSKAKEFAFRDDFGISPSSEYDQHYHPLSDEVAEIEEAKKWLEEFVAVQSGCATGALAGMDLCENQDEAAEIVARIRRKIEVHEKRVAVLSTETESLIPTIATELIFGSLFSILFVFWSTLDLGQRHDDIGVMANYNDWVQILQEKGYVLSLFQGSGSV
mmetsp:Transcript_9536/g.23747  ORF Transcript_9536/g.23747 Transcript_9536/m.23747 type:complete len:223 (+) Transcript_9536:138-806(+)